MPRQEKTSKIVQDGSRIFLSALKSSDPYQATKEMLHRRKSDLMVGAGINQTTFHLEEYRRIFCLGIGKAAAPMAKAVEDALGPHRIKDGHITVKYGHALPLRSISCSEAGHPLPDENSLSGTRKLLDLVSNPQEDDLVFFLISGGGSSLLALPREGISLDDLAQCNRVLIKCGANIREINTIRKHISDVKGGRLAQKLYPATVVNLVISDIVGDPLGDIASGPTIADPSTFHEADAIIRKYQLDRRLPKSIRDTISEGIEGKIPETPKPDDDVFGKSRTFLVSNNEMFLQKAARKAQQHGYLVELKDEPLVGSVEEAAAILYARYESGNSEQDKVVCLISGGETTVNVKGNGLGGRNQELVLRYAQLARRKGNWAIFSLGTDGTDGPTDAAGGFMTSEMIRNIDESELQKYLDNNDSYHLLEKVGGLIKTGPTYTNVMDIQMLFTWSKFT